MLLDLLAVGVDHNSTGLQQVLMEEGFAAATISSYHRYGPADAVSPVEVSMDPVHGDAFGGISVIADHHTVMS